MTAESGNGPGTGTGPWVARPADWFASTREPGQDDRPRRADPYDRGLVPSGQVADEWPVAADELPVAADDEPRGNWYDDDTQEPAEGGWHGTGISRDRPDVTEDDSGLWEGARSRPAGRTVLKVGVAVVVIAVVGVSGATILAKTQGKSTALPGRARTAGTAGRSGAPGAGAPGMAVSEAVLPGYPGRGVSGEQAEGLASAGGTQIAVGTVDGLPAVWRRDGNGSWSLVTGNTAGITGRAAVLTKIQRSPRGWIAIGAPGGGSAPHPVVLVSADGLSWQVVDGEPSFGGPGGYSYGITAGKSEDVVVGKVVSGGRTAAATWWSTDLRHWVRDGNNGGLDGRLKPSQMNAATVTPQRFVAVGQHGRLPAVWLAGVARDWAVTDVPMPAGGTSAALTKVAASGDRIVALGDAVTPGGTVPFAVTSADGGATWREVPISAPSGRTVTVTAVTVTTSGFTAAAQASGTNAIYWTSADGIAWSAPRQADPGIAAITSLIPAGATVTGIGQSPAGHPVIWAAR